MAYFPSHLFPRDIILVLILKRYASGAGVRLRPFQLKLITIGLCVLSREVVMFPFCVTMVLFSLNICLLTRS